MTEPKTHTLEVPGAVLHYDVRDPSQASSEPRWMRSNSYFSTNRR